jgi:poly-gamma-glutamate synthesis protein (capsule biosynthesis protein)
MLKKFLFFIVVFLHLSFLFSFNYNIDNQLNNKSEYADSDVITFIFAGDIMGHIPQLKAAYNSDTDNYDFSACFSYISPYIRSADVAVANLEVPLAGKPYSGYPNFSSPDALMSAAFDAGFDVFLLANNHVMDRGKKGTVRTINTVNQKALFAGAYLNEQQRDSIYPLLIDVKGMKVAVLNCTYGTNGIAVEEPLRVNMIDTLQIKKDVQKSKQRGAEFVFMTIHWGNEYELKANETQIKLAEYFAKIGVNAVIGSHPHVVQNFDYQYAIDSTRVPVFYSLGNMVSNQRWRYSDGGILAKITINKQTHTVENCSYLPFYVHKGEINGVFQYYLLPTTRYIVDKNYVTLSQQTDSLLRVFDSDTKQRLANLKIND